MYKQENYKDVKLWSHEVCIIEDGHLFVDSKVLFSKQLQLTLRTHSIYSDESQQ